MKFLPLSLVIIITLLPNLVKAGDSRGTANYLLISPAKFEGKEVRLDVAYIQPMNWNNSKSDVQFFHASTYDIYNRDFGGQIMVAVLAADSEKFAKKYGVGFKSTTNTLRGILRSNMPGGMSSWIVDTTGKTPEIRNPAQPSSPSDSYNSSSNIWGTDFDAGLKKAATSNKPLLLEFTGSDWCPPCMKLTSTVFETTVFEEFAKKNLVLLKFDFPRKKELPSDLKASNQAVARQFKVNGFPTVILLDSSGTELARKVGYDGKTPEAFIEWVNQNKN